MMRKLAWIAETLTIRARDTRNSVLVCVVAPLSNKSTIMINSLLGKTMRALVASTLGLCAAAATAQDDASTKNLDAASLWRETEAAVRLAESMPVRVSQRELREGEALVITVELPRGGYLNVVSIGPDGVPTVLFPNRVHADNKVVDPGPFVVPTPQMQFELKAGPPYGVSLLAAFLTPEPLDLYANGEGERNASGALLSRFARLSMSGRDVLKTLSTKSLVVEERATPLLAGMTTIVACATVGPCSLGVDTAVDGVVRDIPEALTPGIFLEPEDKALTAKVLNVRPISDKGIKLIMVSEGFVPRLYNDAARYCSVAYGHLVKKQPCSGSESPKFRPGISYQAGADLLVSDMALAQRAVMALVKVPLTDGQYAALCDFTYNVGSGNFKRSTLLKVINAGEHHRVPFQLRRWNKAGGKVLRGLQTRREREVALYFDGAAIPKSAPAGEDETPLDIRTGEPGS